MAQLTKNFTTEEMACNCCGLCAMDPQFMVNLQLLRDRLGKGLIITSGYRCSKRNKEEGGARSSQHLVGKAADIQWSHLNPIGKRRLLNHVIGVGAFTGIGIGMGFIHVDTREGEQLMWTYP